MPDKECPQCHEAVDEAKAFCPACGHAFVDEQTRTDTSAYESADHTMQMGQTMYNSMLSDMGLNVKKEPKGTPLADAAAGTPEKRVEVLKPAAQPIPVAPPTPQPHEPEKKSNSRIWLVTLIVAIALLLIF